MILKTGFGYFVKDGKKVHKFVLKVGEHEVDSSYSVIEVSDQKALDAIVLDKTNEQLALEEKGNKRANLKASAIEKLKTVAGLSDEEINALVGL